MTGSKRAAYLESPHLPNLFTGATMNYLVSWAIGLVVGALYSLLDFRSPAPPAVALVGLLGMSIGEQLIPASRDLILRWLS